MQWSTILAFAHLGDLPPGADPRDDPIQQVQRRAEAVLGDQIASFAQMTQDSSIGLPEEAEVTFVLEVPGFDVKAPTRTFLWVNAVHMEEFTLRATAHGHGGVARGRLLILHGSILLAEVRLGIKVDAQAPANITLTEERTSAARYRKIFPSYSHIDSAIVTQFERYAEAVGDRFLRDVTTLRAGEIWNDRLRDFIREADVFQLFWSRNAMASRFVEQEWRYALSLSRTEFIRPMYWEDPMPTAPGLPPPDLQRIHFHALSRSGAAQDRAAVAPRAVAPAPAPAYGQWTSPPRSVECGPMPPPYPSAPSSHPSADSARPPQSPAAARKHAAWLPVGVIGAVAAVVVGGGISLTQFSDSPSPPAASTASSRTARATTTAGTPSTAELRAAESRLLKVLPDGYGPGACEPIKRFPGTLATVDCAANTNKGGPAIARYSLFDDKASLDRYFTVVVGQTTQLLPCPGNQHESPIRWQSATASGLVACGSYENRANLMWTRDADLMLADARGPDLAALHTWWLQVR
jgi:hypothetical protein